MRAVWILIPAILLASTPPLGEAAGEGVALCVLIDNSGSMDWEGHDPEGMRWEAARLIIDKTRQGDYISLIDFSTKPHLIQPLTAIDGSPYQRELLKRKVSRILSDRKLTDINAALNLALDELSRPLPPGIKKAVILLTDGEVDVVEGTARQKRAAAEASKMVILTETVYRYLKRGIPIYAVALSDEPDMDFLMKLAEYSAPPQAEGESHFFRARSALELVTIFSRIFNELRGMSVYTETFRVNGRAKREINLEDPSVRRMEIQFVHDPDANLSIRLFSPDGKLIRPYASGRSYKLFFVDGPSMGEWVAEIITQRETTLSQSIAVEGEIKLDMPFPPKFIVGSPIEIVVNVRYKGELVVGDSIELSDGRVLRIEGVWCRVVHPDGEVSGEIRLENRFGDYVGSYGEADEPGDYLIQAELKGDLEGRDVRIRSEKRVIGFALDLPEVVISRPKNGERVEAGKPMRVEVAVVKGADRMHDPHLVMLVKGPRGFETLKLDRVDKDRYGGEYVPREAGIYSFKLKRGGFKILSPPVEIEVVPGSGLGSMWLLAPLAALPLLGGGAVILRLRRNKGEVKEKKEEKRREEPRPEAEEEFLGVETSTQELSEEFDIPAEITILGEGGTALAKATFERREDAITGEPFYAVNVKEGEIRHNSKPIVAGEGGKVKDGDTLELGGLAFEVSAKDGKMRPLFKEATAEIERAADEEGMRWVIRINPQEAPSGSQEPSSQS